MKKIKFFIVSITIAATVVSYFMAAGAQIESLSYLYGGSTQVYLNNIKRTGGNLTAVCPDYFEIDKNGDVVQTKVPDPYFIASAHQMGIKVLPFLSNHWNKEYARLALKKPAVIGEKLAKWVKDYDLDGIDVDIENLNEKDREAFTEFVRILRDKLPKGKILSVCVSANPWGLTTGWQGQYNLSALADICDAVFIMAYDEHYDGDSVPGPVAGIDFVEKSVLHALKYVPASKLMLGIPFYGRYWIKGKEVGGKAFTVSDIENMVSRYQSVTWYDQAAQTARASMTITPDDITAGLWGGKKLSAGTYDIWYENDQSYSRKTALIEKYGLKGVGSWALGQEPERIWSSYKGWLYRFPFSDVEGHWAQDAIFALHSGGIVSGIGGGIFNPGGLMTRAEACVLICKLLDIEAQGVLGFIPGDVTGHWAQGYLTACIERNIMSGYPDGSFRPSGLITREEMASLCAKVLHVSEAIDYNQRIYSDVEADSWANNAIVTLSIYSVLSGLPDGSFAPVNPITRAEASSIIYKMTNLSLKVPPLLTPQNRIQAHDLPLEPR